LQLQKHIIQKKGNQFYPYWFLSFLFFGVSFFGLWSLVFVQTSFSTFL
jgi:hypothetical protein